MNLSAISKVQKKKKNNPQLEIYEQFHFTSIKLPFCVFLINMYFILFIAGADQVKK